MSDKIIVDYDYINKGYDYSYIREMKEEIDWSKPYLIHNQWFTKVDNNFVREMLDNEDFIRRFFRCEMNVELVVVEGVAQIRPYNNWARLEIFKEEWDKYWSDKDVEQIKALDRYIVNKSKSYN